MRSRRVETFADRYPLLGPLFWVVCVQYFVVQLIVARSWPIPYSLKNNPISDLGNTACGIFNGRSVCSPQYSLMNASFILLGLTMILGSVLIYHEFKKEDAGSRIGFGGMAVAGIGGILIGLFPENLAFNVHAVGTLLALGVGDVAMLLFGFSLVLPEDLRVFTITFGIISLAGLVLRALGIYLGLGTGGMERVAAYPQTIWLIVFGLYMSKNHFMKVYKRRA